ncbi:hypothetical protein BJY04DRAFT_214758 [Aspergillus karnatakaensis]|uniref:uncharacterized protein n=1 Tax=Aspergillus karnatakaensis TaxID=1810916 RepID=UPI003CCD7CCF
MSQTEQPKPIMYPLRHRCRNPANQCVPCHNVYSVLRHMSDDDLLIKNAMYPVKFLRNFPIPEAFDQFEARLKATIEARLLHLYNQQIKAHVYAFPSPAQVAAVNAVSTQVRVMIDFPTIRTITPQLVQSIFSGLDQHDWQWHTVEPDLNGCWSAFRLDFFNTWNATNRNYI